MTTELPLVGAGQAAPDFVPAPEPAKLGSLARPRRTFVEQELSGSGALTFAMPGSVVLLEGSGVVGAPFMVGDTLVGHVVGESDSRGRCTVRLNTPIEVGAETPLAERPALARKYVFELGHRGPYHRYITFPAEVAASGC